MRIGLRNNTGAPLFRHYFNCPRGYCQGLKWTIRPDESVTLSCGKILLSAAGAMTYVGPRGSVHITWDIPAWGEPTCEASSTGTVFVTRGSVDAGGKDARVMLLVNAPPRPPAGPGPRWRLQYLGEVPNKDVGSMRIDSVLPGETIEVVGEPLSVGRLPECDVRLFSPFVARSHGRLWATDEGIVVEDMWGTNGISVNGIRIEEKTKAILRPGDRVTFAIYEFRVLAPDEA